MRLKPSDSWSFSGFICQGPTAFTLHTVLSDYPFTMWVCMITLHGISQHIHNHKPTSYLQLMRVPSVVSLLALLINVLFHFHRVVTSSLLTHFRQNRKWNSFLQTQRGGLVRGVSLIIRDNETESS